MNTEPNGFGNKCRISRETANEVGLYGNEVQVKEGRRDLKLGITV